MTIKYIKRQKLARNVYEYIFTKPKDLSFKSGQYTEFTSPFTKMDSRGASRWFTISSAPSSDFISFTTKQLTSSASSSFKKGLGHIAKDSIFKISDIYGDFVLPRDSKRYLVFIIAGIGVTPLLSILRELHLNNTSRPIYILYIIEDSSCGIDLSPYVMNYSKLQTVITSKLKNTYNWNNILKFVTVNNLINPLFYISGPDQLVEQINKFLIKKKTPLRNIISDYFDGYDLS